MDLELRVDELLVAPYADLRREHAVATADGHTVRFRLPTGADIEAAVQSAAEPGSAVQLLLNRCLIEPTGPGGAAPALTVETIDELTAMMAALDPQAEIALSAVCPECGEPVRAVLDAAGPVLDELSGRIDELLGEVHTLALHYHWSEDEILALEVPRRRRYLAMLADGPEPGAWT
jgi:hypothetical protein